MGKRYTYFAVMRQMISYTYVFMHSLVSLTFFLHQCKLLFFVFMLHKFSFHLQRMISLLNTLYRGKYANSFSFFFVIIFNDATNFPHFNLII